MSKPIAVVAFGGNALIRAEDHGSMREQLENAGRAVVPLADIVDMGLRLLIVHGNGPQVGNELIRVEESVTKIPPVTLDMCVSSTQGSMAYLLMKALGNELQRRGKAMPQAAVVTQVVVDADDPGFEKPTKPVGPFFSKYRAEKLRAAQGWIMVEDSGRGWRKVVSSPRPLEIIEIGAIRALLDSDVIVIAGGGGGIPVARRPGGSLEGVEAVIDKDYTASLLARDVQAHLFVILTAIDQVYVDFGKPTQKALRRLPLLEARRLQDEGQFPPGSMGPKVRAAIEFLEGGGREVLITSESKLEEALRGEAGTRIVQEGKAEDWGGQQVLFW
jgi:carbamate kinase